MRQHASGGFPSFFRLPFSLGPGFVRWAKKLICRVAPQVTFSPLYIPPFPHPPPLSFGLIRRLYLLPYSSLLSPSPLPWRPPQGICALFFTPIPALASRFCSLIRLTHLGIWNCCLSFSFLDDERVQCFFPQLCLRCPQNLSIFSKRRRISGSWTTPCRVWCSPSPRPLSFHMSGPRTCAPLFQTGRFPPASLAEPHIPRVFGRMPPRKDHPFFCRGLHLQVASPDYKRDELPFLLLRGRGLHDLASFAPLLCLRLFFALSPRVQDRLAVLVRLLNLSRPLRLLSPFSPPRLASRTCRKHPHPELFPSVVAPIRGCLLNIARYPS